MRQLFFADASTVYVGNCNGKFCVHIVDDSAVMLRGELHFSKTVSSAVK